MGCRVVCAFGVVMAILEPTRALSKVDLPTLLRPIRTAKPDFFKRSSSFFIMQAFNRMERETSILICKITFCELTCDNTKNKQSEINREERHVADGHMGHKS